MDSSALKELAYLARIDLDGSETDAFVEQIEKVIEYVSRIHELDTEGVEPTCCALDKVLAMMPDEPWTSVPRDECLGQAPDAVSGFYRVPKIL